MYGLFLALFTFHYSQLSRCKLVKILDYLKNNHRVIPKKIPIIEIQIQVDKGLLGEV